MGFAIQALTRRGSFSVLKRSTFLANQVIITKGGGGSITVDSWTARNYCSTTATTSWLTEVIDAYNNKPMFQDIREYACLSPHPRESLLRDRSFDLLRDKIRFSKTLLLLAEAQFEKQKLVNEEEKEKIDFSKLFGAYKKMGRVEGEALKKYVSDVVYDKVSVAYHQLADSEEPSKGKELFISKNPDENSALWNSKIRNLVLAGKVDGAEFVFEAMPEKLRNMHSWNIMVYCFSNIDLDKAVSYFAASPVRSKLSRLCLMDEYVRVGDIDDAYDLFVEDGKTDTLACNTMLFGYAYFNLVNEACRLFEEMEGNRDVVTYDLMLLHHWHNGAALQEVLKQIPKGETSVTSYNVRLHRLIREESVVEANSVLKEMFDVGLVPDETTHDLVVLSSRSSIFLFFWSFFAR